MRTYLSFWFSSEGASPVEIGQSLKKIGFSPMHGGYDFVYSWDKRPGIDDLLALGNSVQKALKGCQAMFKMETV